LAVFSQSSPQPLLKCHSSPRFPDRPVFFLIRYSWSDPKASSLPFLRRLQSESSA
jgi:hypothetical protein